VSSVLKRVRVLWTALMGRRRRRLRIISQLRIQATFIYVTPMEEILDGCGALHPETLGQTVSGFGREVRTWGLRLTEMPTALCFCD